MKSGRFILLFSSILASRLTKAQDEESTPFCQTQATEEPPDEIRECTAAGAMCESCSSLVTCVATGKGGWAKHPNQYCHAPFGQKCLKNRCVTEPDPKCDGLTKLAFKCKNVGIFPDPFDCKRFHMCVTNNDALKVFHEECEPGFGYNIANGLCDIRLTNGKCRENYPIPLCKTVMDHGALLQKRAMYYMCERYDEEHDLLYPFLFICKGGTVFHPDFTCY